MDIDSFEHRIPFKASGYQNIETLDEKTLEKPIQSFEIEDSNKKIPSVPSIESNEPPPPSITENSSEKNNAESSLPLPFDEDILSSFKPSDDYEPSPELLEIFELLKNDPLEKAKKDFNEKDFEFSEKDLEDFKKPFPEYKFENKAVNSFLSNLNIMTEALQELSDHTLNKSSKKEVTKDFIVVVEGEGEKEGERGGEGKKKGEYIKRKNDIKDEISNKMKKREEEMLKQIQDDDEEEKKKKEIDDNDIKIKEIEKEIINKTESIEDNNNKSKISSKVNYYRKHNEGGNNENDSDDSDDEEFFRSQRDKVKTQSVINKHNNNTSSKQSVLIPMNNEDKIIKQFTSPKKSESEIEKEKILEKVIKQGSPPRPNKTPTNTSTTTESTIKQYLLIY